MKLLANTNSDNLGTVENSLYVKVNSILKAEKVTKQCIFLFLVSIQCF